NRYGLDRSRARPDVLDGWVSSQSSVVSCCQLSVVSRQSNGKPSCHPLRVLEGQQWKRTRKSSIVDISSQSARTSSRNFGRGGGSPSISRTSRPQIQTPMDRRVETL